jgi:hypothetical protein
LALASWNPVCQSTDSQAAVGSIVVHTGFCLVAELIRIKMQVESVTSWMAVERRREKKSMIIVVPSCLKDADGARTRSDQHKLF